jgi:hypothetical protein
MPTVSNQDQSSSAQQAASGYTPPATGGVYVRQADGSLVSAVVSATTPASAQPAPAVSAQATSAAKVA